MNYILDFDHTLLNIRKFRDEVLADGYETYAVPEIWQQYPVRNYLYDDVLAWLKSKPKESLHILTAMTPSLGPLACEYQKEKLQSGNFTEFVEGITFVVGDKGSAAREIAQKWISTEPVVFIDDRLDQCLSVKAALPDSFCFMIVRDGDLTIAVPSEVTAVSTLAEVDAMMEKLV